MTYQNKLGDVKEAMVDMHKIDRAIEFMTKEMPEEDCPPCRDSRQFYRFSNETPYTTDNMERLKAALQNPDEPSYPRDLRTLG